MKKNLYINDINIGDYGIYISSDTYLNGPMIDYTEFQAPARDGNLILDNKRLNNVIRKFDCYIPDNYDLEGGLNKLKKLIYSLRGYFKIVSDYDPDVYQYGYFAEELNVEPFTTKSAHFSLYFSCLPQRWIVENNDIVIGDVLMPFYANGYVSNNDPLLMQVLAKAKNNYNVPYGWLLEMFDGGVVFDPNTTYNFQSSSSLNKEYILCLRCVKGYDVWYEYVNEISDYNLDFTYKTPNINVSAMELYVLMPISDINVDIEVVVNGDYELVNASWEAITNQSFINDDAFGFTPQMIYSKNVKNDEYSNQEGVIDLFNLNGNMYSLDFNKLLDKYTIDEIYNNYGIGSDRVKQMPILVDMYNCKAYILDALSSWNANKILDISNCFTGTYRAQLGDELKMKYGCLRESVNSLFGVSMNGLQIKMGWWKL